MYLAGVPEEEFAPPDPFVPGELDSLETLPAQPYSQEMLHTYLVSLREKCQTKFLQLSDEQMLRPIQYPWSKGQPTSYLELQLYNLRHLQEHATQLSLFLGQHADLEANLGWVARAKDKPGS